MEEKKGLVCEACGGTLRLSEGGGRAVCPYCGRVYDLEKREEAGPCGIVETLRRRAGVVAANFGLAQGRAASDSFDGDERAAERRLLANAAVKDGVLKRYRAREAGEYARIPDEIVRVARRAAYKDKLLGRLSVAPQVKELGAKCFSRCASLTSLRLEGCEKLGARAFAKCEALREVTIARHIPETGKKVFAGCRHISRVILPRSMEPRISRLFGILAKFRIEFVFMD